MTGFGFIEFESSRDAEDVVNNFHNKPFMGSNIVVEFAKETRRRDDRGGDYGGRGGPPPRRTEQRRPVGIRVNVSGISRDTSWQDLKDFGREAGNVSFADVERDMPGRGVLEYLTVEDAELAVRTLDGKDLRGVAVRLALDEHRRWHTRALAAALLAEIVPALRAQATAGATTGPRDVAVVRLLRVATKSGEKKGSIGVTIVEGMIDERSVLDTRGSVLIGGSTTGRGMMNVKGVTEAGTIADRRIKLDSALNV
ncbi:hypothetical protein FRC05_009788 [Tulasnella sp. 425]|nr:hypothetical protein FRC05_009788 [Tulasnella sp. 425]